MRRSHKTVVSSLFVIAAALYQLAMRDELLLRFKAADMPALPPRPGVTPTPSPSPRPTSR